MVGALSSCCRIAVSPQAAMQPGGAGLGAVMLDGAWMGGAPMGSAEFESRYGDTPIDPSAAVPPSGPDYYTQTLTAFSPLIQSVASQMTDPMRQTALLRAKLQNALQRGAPESELRLLRAKLEAAERAAGIRTETEQSGREWRNLGKYATVAGVGLVGALTVFVLVRAIRG